MRLLGGIVIGVVAWFAIYLYGAWWAMVTLGAAHSYNAAVPAFGYSTVFFLLASLSTIASAPIAYLRVGDAVNEIGR